MNPQQLADSIIEDEQITNDPVTPDPTPTPDDTTPPDNPEPPKDDDNPSDPEPTADDKKPEDDKDPVEPRDDEPKPDETKEPEVPTAPPLPTEPPKSESQVQEEATTLLQTLELTDDKVFTDNGEVRPFTEVVPVGEFLAKQLEPITVVDKEGNEHQFTILDEVKEKFPNGFEARNNIEQMEFQQAIMQNTTKFRELVGTYNKANEQYTKETNMIVQQRSDNARIREEYNSMAKQGLVPKVEGDPNDPKFLEQPAVKELDKLLQWQETKNAELRAQGLGQINSLWVAKQLMDAEAGNKANDEKKEKIVQDRKQVASLTATGTPTPEKDAPKNVPQNVPMSRLADEIIAQEGLR